MAIPKADIHLHAETRARLDRLLAPRSGLKPHDWRLWAERVSELEPGPARFEALAVARHGLGSELDPDQFEVLNDDANFVVWLTGAMLDAAHDGAVLIEVRFGAGYSLRSGVHVAVPRGGGGRTRSPSDLSRRSDYHGLVARADGRRADV